MAIPCNWTAIQYNSMQLDCHTMQLDCHTMQFDAIGLFSAMGGPGGGSRGCVGFHTIWSEEFPVLEGGIPTAIPCNSICPGGCNSPVQPSWTGRRFRHSTLSTPWKLEAPWAQAPPNWSTARLPPNHAIGNRHIACKLDWHPRQLKSCVFDVNPLT